jgi:signal transduction histidine kinase
MKKKRVLIYFCICLALFALLGISFVSLSKLNALEKYNERVDHSYQVIIQTNSLEQNLLNAETGQRAFLLTEEPAFLENYLGELKGIPGIFVELDRLTSDNHTQQLNLDTLKNIINLQLRLLKSNLNASLEDTAMMSRFRESNIYMNKIREIISNIKKNESYLLAKRTQSKELNNKESKDSSFLSLVIAFAVCCAAAIAIITFFNSSEVHRSNLEQKIRELNILNKEVRELTLASTHNLQEPMRKIQVMIDRLQHLKDADSERLQEQIDRIKQIYNQQREINNNIVNYYQILSGSGEKEKVELNTWLPGLVRENNWEQAFTLRMDPVKAIEADPYQLRLLFSHILNNSIRFAHPERPLVIRISGGDHVVKEGKYLNREKKTYYRITISDNGIGIHEDYHKKIFQMFQKVEEVEHPTTGMGLSFCKRIMLNHQGWIAAQNHEPHGFTLCLFFPAV